VVQQADPRAHRYAVILAGGRGTRLWPISTEEQPKQFKALGDSRSLIAQTFDRLAACVGDDHIYVSTTAEYVDDVHAALPRLDPDHLVVEPRPEGKPAAFLLVAAQIHGDDPDAIILSAASDSSVSPLDAFTDASTRAFDFVESHPTWTTLLGAKPTRADTSLGYVRATGSAMGVRGVHVARDFTEKPTPEAAETFLATPGYFWNTSHYCFAASTLIESYRQAAPEFVERILGYARSGDETAYDGEGGPDHELSPLIDGWPIGVLTGELRWYDIGTWPSLYRALEDSEGSPLITSGRHVDLDSASALVINDNPALTVVTAGLDGLAVVVSDQVVLVAPIKQLEEQPATIARMQSEYAAQPPAERDPQ